MCTEVQERKGQIVVEKADIKIQLKAEKKKSNTRSRRRIEEEEGRTKMCKKKVNVPTGSVI